ncbi:leucine-rich repeat-containing protein 38 [Latimeria chalumnae]|uniref:Leucine rich repeat containing 38 n=1 Tax=Latimeria chalumnae TaxID=7897 RepID=H3AI12_LATCH|nr:PREDICTED: leucine-rich repeat-containing protein 38 [Latimeria chalumnae]|eukprot:XP_006005246.1 PREDICTED: leucine-rich repeat-containing protein 38 [Latimeria chalumnae]
MLPCFPFCLVPSVLLCCLLYLPLGLSCPSVCVCADYHTIDCRDQGLSNLPSSFPLDVRRLFMANNQIQVIPADFFIFYGDLIYLDLRNNCLTSIEDGTFFSSAKLVFLDLSYNNLTSLGAGVFKSAEKLIKLSLGNNNLVDVDEAAFESLESLQVLELNNNSLESINVAILKSLPLIRILRLEGNPWMCDCAFASLYAWLLENQHKLQKDLDGIQCSLPEENRKVSFNELSESSFNECQFTLSLIDYLIIIFSGVMVSIAAILTSFFLATTVHCFQKFGSSNKDEDEEDSED